MATRKILITHMAEIIFLLHSTATDTLLNIVEQEKQKQKGFF
jgi:hypothetical protein